LRVSLFDDASVAAASSDRDEKRASLRDAPRDADDSGRPRETNEKQDMRALDIPRRAFGAGAKDEDEDATTRRKNLGTSENDETKRKSCAKGCEKCEEAALNGHLECLKYLHERGCPWDEYTCSAAASNGHLECLKYLHENGCPWHEWTCEYVALGGRLEYLKYYHEHECRCDERTCWTAVSSGRLECLKYAHEHGCPDSAHYAKALNEVCIPDADERFGVELALMFHRAGGGEISMREFLPIWKELRGAHLIVALKLAQAYRTTQRSA